MRAPSGLESAYGLCRIWRLLKPRGDPCRGGSASAREARAQAALRPGTLEESRVAPFPSWAAEPLSLETAAGSPHHYH
jgi:hypothetical protein